MWLFLFVFLTGTLPSPKETIKGNIKTVTEYKIDDDGKKIKVILDLIYLHVIKYHFVVNLTGHVLGLHQIILLISGFYLSFSKFVELYYYSRCYASIKDINAVHL